jgi:hypothetical protein
LAVEIKENKMGRACGTYGRHERSIQGFVWRCEGRNHLEDLGVDGRIVLK